MTPTEGPDKRPLLVLVDDQRETLAALRRVLSSEPYEVLTTTDPQEVLDWVRSRAVDLVVADYRMPAMSGTDLLRAVQTDSPDTSSMILTAYPDTSLVCERTSLRIRRLLTKPWDDGRLRHTIREVLHEREGLQPFVDEGGRLPALRIECRNARSEEVLAQIRKACRPARKGAPARVVVIENLPLLEGSVSAVLKGMLRAAAESDVRLAVSDASGLAAAFIGVLRADSVVMIK